MLLNYENYLVVKIILKSFNSDEYSISIISNDKITKLDYDIKFTYNKKYIYIQVPHIYLNNLNDVDEFLQIEDYDGYSKDVKLNDNQKKHIFEFKEDIKNYFMKYKIESIFSKDELDDTN